MLGDLVVYLGEGDDCLHVGLVVGSGRPLLPGGEPFPLVLSKWDDASGEYVHQVQDHPFSQFRPRWEYWTERPVP